MTTQIRTTGALFAGVLLLSAALPDTAFAVDGQIAITQARAMAGGVTPGDAPGFPISINQPGSYVLSGNLTTPDANTDVIEINASHVTIDLNGFAILGPTDCSGGLNPCAGAGTGYGVTTPNVQFNITIRNGTIQGMGYAGILLWGDSDLVEYVHARSNGSYGINILASPDGGSSIVQHAMVQRNGNEGIFITYGTVAHSVADSNDSGITMAGGSAINNVSRRNRFGLFLLGKTSFIGNVLSDNTNNLGGGGGHNMGQNLCDAAPCPGAQF